MNETPYAPKYVLWNSSQLVFLYGPYLRLSPRNVIQKTATNF